MSVTGDAVHWWEEQQLRILVLCSLIIQFLLFFFSYARRYDVPRSLRSMLWLAYLAGDAVAIYALAMLFNRHKDKGSGGSNSNSSSLLEVIWAPVLLIHLGGQDAITAYNIEDNELWSRHLLTAVSQVTVAIYVFCKTWPRGGGDKRLLQAAIVLFVPGVLKCFAKPWALKSASIYSLVSSPAAAKQTKGVMYPLEEYVKRAKDFVQEQTTTDGGEAQGERASSSMEDEGTGTAEIMIEMIEGHNEMSKLFVDISSSYSRRLDILKDFWGLTEERAYGSVRRGLATAFLLLYTKIKTLNWDEKDDRLESNVFLPMQVSRMLLPWAAIGLFQHSHREVYNDIDVKITYILLCCTAVLELFSVLSIGDVDEVETWPEMVAQRSFIGGYVARSTEHSSNNRMRMVSLLLGCKQGQEADPCYSSRRIAGLVHRHLKAGWQQKIQNVASYRRFNDNRGHWAIEVNKLEDRMGWSIEGPFDESVLRWHIATDLCFFLCPSSSDDKSALCTQMSNYMAHLLLVNPDMLLPGSRRNLFKTAQEELDAIFKNIDEELPPGLDKKALAQKIDSKLNLLSSASQLFQNSGGRPPSGLDNRTLAMKIDSTLQSSPSIYKAWILAQKLQSLHDKNMWKVIQDVWVEMLCYSAGRCRGYLHAKALGQGGEFLSYVWLLMFHMGMETFTDKLQREDHPRRHRAAGTGKNNATTAPPSTPEQQQVPSTTGGTCASASDAHTDAAGVSAAPSTSEICRAEDMV